MNQEKIGNFIKSLRESKNMTQEELAEKVPIGRGAISKWERGKTFPDISTLTRLSSIFNVSVDEILAGEKNPKKSIALEIYKDKKRIAYKFKISIILFILSVLIFLTYYFFNQYMSINVYTIKGIGKNFDVDNGIFLRTNEKIYFNLGEIINKNEYVIDKIELYYLDQKKENVIYTTSYKSMLFYDNKGYNEFFDFDKLNYVINHLYLKIYYNNSYENILLNLNRDYVNNNLLFFQNKKISNKVSKKININNNEELIKKIKNHYILKNDNYFMENINKDLKIELTFIDDINSLNILIIQDKQILEEYIYDLVSNIIDYRNKEDINYISLNSHCKCISINCKKDQDYSQICSKLNKIIIESLN